MAHALLLLGLLVALGGMHTCDTHLAKCLFFMKIRVLHTGPVPSPPNTGTLCATWWWPKHGCPLPGPLCCEPLPHLDSAFLVVWGISWALAVLAGLCLVSQAPCPISWSQGLFPVFCPFTCWFKQSGMPVPVIPSQPQRKILTRILEKIT